MILNRKKLIEGIHTAYISSRGKLLEALSLQSDKAKIAPGLKVSHEGSGLRYDVVIVGSEGVKLRAPDGGEFVVRRQDFEREYSIG